MIFLISLKVSYFISHNPFLILTFLAEIFFLVLSCLMVKVYSQFMYCISILLPKFSLFGYQDSLFQKPLVSFPLCNCGGGGSSFLVWFFQSLISFCRSSSSSLEKLFLVLTSYSDQIKSSRLSLASTHILFNVLNYESAFFWDYNCTDTILMMTIQ